MTVSSKMNSFDVLQCSTSSCMTLRPATNCPFRFARRCIGDGPGTRLPRWLVVVLSCCATVLLLFRTQPDLTLLQLPLASRNDQYFSVSQDNPHLPRCRTPGDMLDGQWTRRPHVTAADEAAQGALLEELRRQRGIIGARGRYSSVERGDRLCGAEVPGHKQSNPYLTVHTPAWCDPRGATPCCAARGRCINSTLDQCACPGCFDLRREGLHAELAAWQPRTCRMKRFTDDAVCDMMVRAGLHLIFVGDSLMRQFLETFLSHTTNRNKVPSSTQPPSTTTTHRRRGLRTTACGTQYRPLLWISEARCRHGIWPTCWRLGEDQVVARVKASRWAEADVQGLLKDVLAWAQVPNSFLVMGVGVHHNCDIDQVLSTYLEPLMQPLGRSEWPHLVWLTTHTNGRFKPVEFSRSQSTERCRAMAEAVRAFLGERLPPDRYTVMDVLNASASVISYDGTHFTKGFNKFKVQVLANFLAVRVGYAGDSE